MEKVYCKDCIHCGISGFVHGDFDELEPVYCCNIVSGYKDTFYAREAIYIDPIVSNIGNSCRYYEAKERFIIC